MTAKQFNKRFLMGRKLGPSGFLVPHGVPQIVCADGFSVSVQASNVHYCTPREGAGPWTHVELGFPTEPVPVWLDYAEDRDNPTETVYGYIPLSLVLEGLAVHGGISEDQRTWRDMEKARKGKR